MMNDFEARWREHYEWRAQRYANEAAASAYSDRSFAARMQTLSSLLQRLRVPPGARSLDVGCASGAYVRALRRAGHRAIGLDYALAHLARARAADAESLHVAGDGYALPFADGAFDLVTCMGVLQLVARPARLMAEAERVLRPDGILIVEALNGASLAARAMYLRDTVRRRPLTHALHGPDAVRRCLLEAGFEAVRTQGLYALPAQAAALQGWLDRHAVGAALDRWPALNRHLANAMFFVARKPGRGEESRALAGTPGACAHRTSPPSS